MWTARRNRFAGIGLFAISGQAVTLTEIAFRQPIADRAEKREEPHFPD